MKFSRIDVTINGRFLSQPATGVQRYAYQLINGWDKMLERGEIDSQRYHLEILTPKGDIPKEGFQHISIRQVGRLQGNLWEQIELPWYTRGKFLFNPGNIAPILKLNQAVTIHDASVFAVPYSYSLPFIFKYRLVYSILAKTAKLVVTVSNFSKTELIKYCRFKPQNMIVIPEGSDHILRIEPDQTVLEKFNLGKKPYILTVGSNASHKNLAVVYRAAEMIPAEALEIAVVGGDFNRWFNVSGATPNDRVKKIGYISDSELKALYQEAIALVFPSLYEGFGLPPLEAMACGCPVIVSKSSSLPEVCGDAALYFDPCQPQELVENINNVVNNPGLRSELRVKGFSQANKFHWSLAAKTTWESLVKYLR